MEKSEARNLELVDLVNIAWKRKWLIGAGTGITLVAALILSLSTPRSYKATATLLLSESKIPPPGDTTPPGMAAIPMDTYAAMVSNQSLALETVRHFGLDRGPSAVTAEQFLNSKLTVEVPAGSRLLIVSVIMPEAQLAAEVANFVANEAVALNAELNQSETLGTRDVIAGQRDNAARSLDTAQTELVAFRKKANLRSLEAEQTALLNAKAEYVQLLSNYSIQLKGLQADVEELRNALSGQQPILTLNKSIFLNPELLAAARESGVTDIKSLAGVELKSQEINTNYQTLQLSLIEKEARIASLNSQRQDVELKVKENEDRLVRLQQRIAEAESRLEELTQNYELEKSAYELFSNKYAEAYLSVASRGAELKVLDQAIPPTIRYRPRIKFNLMLAGAAGVILFTILAFFAEYLLQFRITK